MKIALALFVIGKNKAGASALPASYLHHHSASPSDCDFLLTKAGTYRLRVAYKLQVNTISKYDGKNSLSRTLIFGAKCKISP